MFEFARKVSFDEKAFGNKSTRDKSLIRLLRSAAVIASGISTIFLPENHFEVCDRLRIIVQEKQAGNNFDIINEGIVAIADKLSEYKSISTKQHKFLLLRCFN